MAYDSLGFGTIAPGDANAQRWWFRLGFDRGTEFFTAHPLNPGSELVVSDFSKKRELDGSITYQTTVKNVGPFTTNFSWQGGGMV